MGERDRIVSYARANIGASYSTIPSGGEEGVCYNCSFLTKCAYAAAGLDIPGWQGHQNGEGSQSDWVRWNDHWTTDPDELQAGDLVFFGDSPYNTGHVGISLGGSLMIDSVPSGGVQERELYGSFVGGGWPLPALPDDDAWQLIPARGTVQFDRRMNIRTSPSTDAPRLVDEDGNPITYEAGETLNIDGFVLHDGYTWAHYIGSNSKADRFVALSGDVQFAKAVDA